MENGRLPVRRTVPRSSMQVKHPLPTHPVIVARGFANRFLPQVRHGRADGHPCKVLFTLTFSSIFRPEIAPVREASRRAKAVALRLAWIPNVSGARLRHDARMTMVGRANL